MQARHVYFAAVRAWTQEMAGGGSAEPK